MFSVPINHLDIRVIGNPGTRRHLGASVALTWTCFVPSIQYVDFVIAFDKILVCWFVLRCFIPGILCLHVRARVRVCACGVICCLVRFVYGGATHFFKPKISVL